MEKPKERRDDVRRHNREVDGKTVRVYERIHDPLLVGRKVIVERGDGTIEDGWEILDFLDRGQTAVVKKLGESMELPISTRRLEELNPPQDSSQ